MKERENEYQNQLQSVNYQENSSASKQNVKRKQNQTGIPDRLKTLVEYTSGLSLDEVRVHYSAESTCIDGFNIYLADGQEKQLANQLWTLTKGLRSQEKSPLSPKQNSKVGTDKKEAVSKNKTGLPDKLKTGIESSSGYSLDDVKVHYNSREPDKLHAHAYAQGSDIHIAPKQEEHLPHEAWHVVQQKQGRVNANPQLKAKGQINDDKNLENEADNKSQEALGQSLPEGAAQDLLVSETTSNTAPIQLLEKNSYPWTGTVIKTPLLAVRESPSNNGITLADLPKNTLVKVIANSSGWLEVEIDTSQSDLIINKKGKSLISGGILKGYCYNDYIDDAVAAEMTSIEGKKATWVPSGPGSGNTFEAWASATSKSKAPDVNKVTTINCWEMVLLAAYRIGAVDWNWIHNLYTASKASWGDKLPRRMTSGAFTTYDHKNQTPLPQRGDLVFFDGAAHVALATGNGDEIFTFWPPPNTAFTGNGTVDAVKKSTIKELSDWMTAKLNSTPVVTFGKPAW